MSNDSNDNPEQPKPQQIQQQQNQFQQQQQFLAQGQSMQSGSQSAQKFKSSAVDSERPWSDFFSNYQPPDGSYDENLDEGQTRAHWNSIASGLSEIGTEGMERRVKQIRRGIHQNGIAFSAYGDPAVRQRHLQLDPLPHLIQSQQWQLIDAALKQRAKLLNMVLADLYGPRTLLTDGVLPADLLFSHPHYQLPYHGLPTPGGKHLHFYAAEIARAPDGKWWFVSERSDSPEGIGFALENRIVISRAFPNQFRQSNVPRLAPYFIALKEHLVRLANTNRDNPHIAILSAGAGSASYFEDSFLAKYLGFSIVQSNDLVVRSRQVMLKTLAGLVPIDVIFRRLQGNSLDPLELGGGVPGIPGILQCIRDGNVVVTNAPGSGLVESPIFMAFMPRICQSLLGCDLLIPGLATWWGGEPESLKIILERIDDLRLLPAFRWRTGTGVRRRANRPIAKSLNPETLTSQQRIQLVKDDPEAWVGQEKIARSSTAVWQDGGLQPGYVSMRTFLTATGDSWHALPGGLVRVSETANPDRRNPLRDGGTKDAWVLSDQSVPPTSLLRQSGERLEISRSKGSVPSRIADNLCWLGRYLERASAGGRLLRAVVARLTSESAPEESVELPALVRALSITGQIDPGFAIKEFSNLLPRFDGWLPGHTLNQNESNSLRSQVDQIVLLAGTLRDRLSSDAWRTIQQIRNNFESSNPATCDLVDLLDITDTMIVGLAAFSGFVSDFMTRTHAFSFLNIGRRLEHSLQIVSLIQNCLGRRDSVSPELLEALLEISDSGLTYRSRYFASLQLPAVLDLLLLDEMNPRSLAHQIVRLISNLDSLPGNSAENPNSVEQKLAAEVHRAIFSIDGHELADVDSAGRLENLYSLMSFVEEKLPVISTTISNRFLVHSGTVTQMIAEQ